MNKFIVKNWLFLLFALVSFIFISGCKNVRMKTLSQMLKEEKMNIERLVRDRNFQVKQYVEGQKDFDPDVYYIMPNGLYMRVMDMGKEKPVVNKTIVAIRFKGELFREKIIYSFDNLSKAAYQSTEFLYIDEYTYTGAMHYKLTPPAPGENLNRIMCEGLAYPMSILGNGAKVSLIVPFRLAFDAAYSSGSTMFCEEVRYEFIIR